MPRHRKERVPLERARRLAKNAARRVPLRAAQAAERLAPEPSIASSSVTGPVTTEKLTTETLTTETLTTKTPVIEQSTPVEAAAASMTVPLPAFRRHLLQVASPAGPSALGGASPVARAARRLMVTPWFAVATGFVVAAGLWIYSPHAELKFPNNVVRVPCGSLHCGPAQPNGVSIPNSAANRPITNGQSAGRVPTSRPPTVTYRVLWQSQGKFSMLIKVPGKRVPRIWRLTFDLPGVKIIAVEWAAWHRSSSSGGTASWPPSHTLWLASGHSGGGDRFGREAGTAFVVIAMGTPVAPTSCTFNGTGCKVSWAASGG